MKEKEPLEMIKEFLKKQTKEILEARKQLRKKYPKLKNNMNKIKKEALALLKLLHAKQKKYEKLNDKIRNLIPEFTPYVQSIDDDYLTGVTKLLDEILGDELASYLLFETDGSDSYYYQLKENKKFPIRNVDDIIKYMDYRDAK